MRYLVLAALVAFGGCSDDEETTNNTNNNDENNAQTVDFAPTVTAYANLVSQTYADSITAAEAMDEALDAFVADPTDANLTAAKNAWLAAREPYLLTEAFRFYGGPIDNETDGPEGLLNAWPLDETYIDTIIDGSEEITKATLEAANESGGDKNISTGYHAIEYLLWGQDTNDDGPGNRPVSDFVDASGAERRKLYLTTTSELLLDNLNAVADQWKSDGAYRTTFVGEPEKSAERILTGMIVLTGFETGGERLQPALDEADQEEEHSCFSDNTHRDMIQDVQGVINVYEGKYGTVDGPGVRELVAQKDEALATNIGNALTDALAKANALPVPFDQAIQEGNTDGRQKVQDLITSLRAAEDLLEDAFKAFEFSIPNPE